jgi:hypothetical protein
MEVADCVGGPGSGRIVASIAATARPRSGFDVRRRFYDVVGDDFRLRKKQSFDGTGLARFPELDIPPGRSFFRSLLFRSCRVR